MSTYELSVETPVFEVEIGNAGGVLSASLAKAGKVALALTNIDVAVSFVSAINSTADFTLLLTVQNTQDSFPQILTAQVKTFTVNGFEAQVNAPPDTANYVLNWMLVPCVNG